jgi:hypothetical protein
MCSGRFIEVVEPKKAVSSRERHGHQELSRVNKVTAFFPA